MKNSMRRHPVRESARQQRMRTALGAQREQSPELFSDRDDDAAERAKLMRDFELAREESLGADRYN